MNEEYDGSSDIPDEVDELLVQHDRDAEIAALLDEKEHMVVAQIGGKPPKHLAKLLKANAKTKTKKVVTDYPWEFEGHEPPTDMFIDRNIGTEDVPIPRTSPVLTRKGYLTLRGRGSMESPIDVLFVHSCVTQAEYDVGKLPPAMLRCPSGNLFLRNLERAGFEAEDETKRVKWYYTCIAKYNTPKGKLSPQDIRWGTPALENEIEVLKPKIIVCFGKPAFDFFVESRKLPMKDIQGAFFTAKKSGIKCYVMDSIHVVLRRPEYTDRFMTDLRNVRQEVDAMRGYPRIEVPQQYVTISKASELFNVMANLKAKQVRELAVDCEWHGQTSWGGRLRSMQFCWQAGHAAYLRLMDEKTKYAFDRPIETVRQIIAPVFNDPQMKFIGHNGSADMPWMHDHLGIEVYQKFVFDTMYAQHTINEYADLKLERLAVKYTPDLGRYDLDLLIWKKSKKFDEEDNEGYGFVPDRIIIPYGCRDVDATFRCRFPLFTELRRQGLLRYYNEFVLPFVTDGFHEMMDCGLPVNLEFLDDMRDTFTRNRDLLITEFRHSMVREAKHYLQEALKKLAPDRWQNLALEINKLMREETTEATMEAERLFKSCFNDEQGHLQTKEFLPVFLHFAEAPKFNINSKAHLKRWLFDIKKLVPVKTTKRDGYFLSWEKFLAMDKKRQEELNPEPATDKQVIKIYAEREPLVAQLQELQSLANIVKAFLKGPDEETGKEQGIHRWIQPDGRIHANFALTETARPRAWKPNILNWPKAITKPIESGFKRINDQFEEECRKKLEAMSPDLTQDRAAIEAELVRLKRKPTSLRANVEAPEGWCIIDMDLKTAEVVALAYQAADSNMIKVLTEPDVQFARIDKENPKKVVRIGYNSNEGVPESEWDPKLLVPVDDPRILRDANGQILHPKRDLHWEMGCAVAKKPREKCDERMTRDGCGKVGNFCLYEGSPVLTNRGNVPIEQVKLTDLLWDGQEWVSHDGVVCNGIKTVREYGGLWATDNHEVWVGGGKKVTFGEARMECLELIRTTDSCGKAIYCGFSDIPENNSESWRWVFHGDDSMSYMRPETRKRIEEYGAWPFFEVSMSEPALLWGSQGHNFAASIQCHEATLRDQYACLVPQIQREGHTGAVQIQKGVRVLGLGEMARLRFQKSGFRSHRQQRSLLQGESTLGGPIHQSEKQAIHDSNKCGSCQKVSTGSPGDYLYRENCLGAFSHGHDSKAVGGASPKNGSNLGEAKTKTGRVYDILNAGPRHRFTCSGVLVSNSIPYGATPTLLERMIESNTGIKPPDKTGEDMIRAWEERYPAAAKFQEEMAKKVKDPGWWRSLSGRVRHFMFAELEDLDGFAEADARGILSGLGRQSRNFPCQEIVAATTAKALLMFIDDRRKMGLRSRIGILLYDAITAFAPLEQAKATAALLRDCLTSRNSWNTAGGLFHFEVDTTIGFRWGVKATAEEKKIIDHYMK